MGTAELFRAFDSRIVSSDSEWEEATLRLLTCKGVLAAHYYGDAATTGYWTLVGSVAKGTSISPITDVDGVFHMPTGSYARFDEYSGSGQSALLQEVRGLLAARYPRTKIRGDGPVVVVEFVDGPSVEIVPAVLIEGAYDFHHVKCHVPVTRDGGAWEVADYGTEYDNFATVDTSTQSQYARLIRYMKVWRRTWGVSYKSVVLELMAAEFMRNWSASRTSHVYDDWLVRDFLAHMIANYYSVYVLPGGKHIDTGVGWIEQAKRSRADAVAACGLLDTASGYVSNWRRVLGSDFGI